VRFCFEVTIVEDMVAILTSFCARLYGKRGAKNRALKAAAAASYPTVEVPGYQVTPPGGHA